MDVNVKLEFANRQELQRMIDFLWKIDCPMGETKCDECLYHQCCLKLRDIGRTLESVVLYEE